MGPAISPLSRLRFAAGEAIRRDNPSEQAVHLVKTVICCLQSVPCRDAAIADTTREQTKESLRAGYIGSEVPE